MPDNHGEKFLLYLQKKGLNDTQAAKMMGVSSEQISNYCQSKRFQRSTITKLQSVFNDFILNDIEREEYDRQNQYETVTPSGNITTIHTNKRNSKALIPFYNADFMAGNAEVFYEDGVIHPEYFMDVPEFAGCTAFRNYGDSMEPKIRSGSILFGIKIQDWKSNLEYGQIYGITCTDGRRYLKYIRKFRENPKRYFLLESENKLYDEFELPKEKIKNIWLIEGWLDKRT